MWKNTRKHISWNTCSQRWEEQFHHCFVFLFFLTLEKDVWKHQERLYRAFIINLSLYHGLAFLYQLINIVFLWDGRVNPPPQNKQTNNNKQDHYCFANLHCTDVTYGIVQLVCVPEGILVHESKFVIVNPAPHPSPESVQIIQFLSLTSRTNSTMCVIFSLDFVLIGVVVYWYSFTSLCAILFKSSLFV